MQISVQNLNPIAEKDTSTNNQGAESSESEVQLAGFASIFTGLLLPPDMQNVPQLGQELSMPTGEESPEKLLAVMKALTEGQSKTASPDETPLSESDPESEAPLPRPSKNILPKANIKMDLSSNLPQEKALVGEKLVSLPKDGQWLATKAMSPVTPSGEILPLTTSELKPPAPLPPTTPVVTTSIVHTTSELQTTQNIETREVAQVIERSTL